MQLISEEQALIALYQYNDLPNNSHVTVAHMGYQELTTVDKDIIFVPVWQFFVQNNGQKAITVTVNAINGAIMK